MAFAKATIELNKGSVLKEPFRERSAVANGHQISPHGYPTPAGGEEVPSVKYPQEQPTAASAWVRH
jgi:hypothetical protein